MSSAQLRDRAALRKLLDHIVTKALVGEAAGIKQITVGLEAFQVADSRSSTVRVYATRLRAALHEYYENDGKADPVILDLPPGRYVPRFRWRDQETPQSGGRRVFA